MNRPKRRSKKDARLKAVQTSTPILGKLTGEKFPSFKRLSIIKAQCERDIREIQSLQENKRLRLKSLSISGIYRDTSEQHLESRQRIVKREESDSFTKVIYKRASIEQPSLLLSNENYDPFQQSRSLSKECSFSLDDAEERGLNKRKRIAFGSKTASKSGNSLGGKIRPSVSSKSDRKGRDYVGALTDVGNFQGDVSDPDVVSSCVSKRSGIRIRKEGMKEVKPTHSLEIENKVSKTKRRTSRTRNLTSGRVVRRKPTRDNSQGKKASKIAKSSSGKGFSVECTEDIKSNHSDAPEKESKTNKKRKGSTKKRSFAIDILVMEEPTSENVRSEEALKTIGNESFGTRSSSRKTSKIEISYQDTDGDGNDKIKTLRKRKNTNGLSGNPPRENDQGSEMNNSTPVNKRAGPRKGVLKKKLWNDPLMEKNLPLSFIHLDESDKINEETDTDKKTKTSSEISVSCSNVNTSNNGFQKIMEESNEFLPPSTHRLKNGKDPKRNKNTASAILKRGIFKKPSQERLLSKVLKKSVKAKNLSQSSSQDKENSPYPSTSTPLDSPVSDCKSMPALFQGLSPVLERPMGFSSVNEASCVNITYSKANRAVKESKLDLMWNSLLNLESNGTFVNNTALADPEPERKEEGGSDEDDIRLFESPPRTLLPPVGRTGMVGSRINQSHQPSRIKEEVEETLQHSVKSRSENEGEFLECSRKSPDVDDVLEERNQDLLELSEWELCCERVPYTRHDHLLNL